MKRIILLLACLCLVLSSFGCGKETDENEGLTAAYDFTMQDKDGNELRLSSLADKPIVLNFWASWCGPCVNEMPEFQEMYERYGEDVNFVMVSVDDTKDEAYSFIEEKGYTFPVYYDANGEGGYFYGVSSIPRTYFINSDGYIAKFYTQAISSTLLDAGIKYITE